MYELTINLESNQLQFNSIVNLLIFYYLNINKSITNQKKHGNAQLDV